MDNIRNKALEISSKYQFSTFSVVASAENATGDSNHTLESCNNHLDAEFMEWLAQGLHLDTDIVPL